MVIFVQILDIFEGSVNRISWQIGYVGFEARGGIKDDSRFLARANGRIELVVTAFPSSQIRCTRSDTYRPRADLTKFEIFFSCRIQSWECFEGISKGMIILVEERT